MAIHEGFFRSNEPLIPTVWDTSPCSKTAIGNHATILRNSAACPPVPIALHLFVTCLFLYGNFTQGFNITAVLLWYQAVSRYIIEGRSMGPAELQLALKFEVIMIPTFFTLFIPG